MINYTAEPSKRNDELKKPKFLKKKLSENKVKSQDSIENNEAINSTIDITN